MMVSEGNSPDKLNTLIQERKKMKNANFKKTALIQGYGSVTYGIENYEGMTEEEIIDACDPNNFGGHVYGSLCKVFID